MAYITDVELGNGEEYKVRDDEALHGIAFEQDLIDALASPTVRAVMLDYYYPVGSFYMSNNDTDPGTLFGGTWVRIVDRFLLASGTKFTPGSVGGSADAIVPYHAHAVSGMVTPSGGGHKHPVRAKYGTDRLAIGTSRTQYHAGGDNISTAMATIEDGTGTHSHVIPAHMTLPVGREGDTANANMPPYIGVYCWRRTA